MIGPMRTVVAFHAHPDDEALLTGGTLAGHVRVLAATWPWPFRKRAAPAAHHSQRTGSSRTARLIRSRLRLPVPVFAVLLGYEWLAEPSAAQPPGGMAGWADGN